MTLRKIYVLGISTVTTTTKEMFVIANTNTKKYIFTLTKTPHGSGSHNTSGGGDINDTMMLGYSPLLQTNPLFATPPHITQPRGDGTT